MERQFPWGRRRNEGGGFVSFFVCLLACSPDSESLTALKNGLGQGVVVFVAARVAVVLAVLLAVLVASEGRACVSIRNSVRD